MIFIQNFNRIGVWCRFGPRSWIISFFIDNDLESRGLRLLSFSIVCSSRDCCSVFFMTVWFWWILSVCYRKVIGVLALLRGFALGFVSYLSVFPIFCFCLGSSELDALHLWVDLWVCRMVVWGAGLSLLIASLDLGSNLSWCWLTFNSRGFQWWMRLYGLNSCLILMLAVLHFWGWNSGFVAASCPVVVGVFWISALWVFGSEVACVVGLLVWWCSLVVCVVDDFSI